MNLLFMRVDDFQGISLSFWLRFHMFIIIGLVWFIIYEELYQVINYKKFLTLSLYYS